MKKPGQKFFEVLKQKLTRFIKSSCEDPECLISKTEKGGNCKSSEVVYQIIRKVCYSIYIYTGETHSNGHTRGKEHVKDSKKEDKEGRKKSVLSRHEDEKHEGVKAEYDMKVVKSFQNNAMARQLTESILIRETPQDKKK